MGHHISHSPGFSPMSSPAIDDRRLSVHEIIRTQSVSPVNPIHIPNSPSPISHARFVVSHYLVPATSRAGFRGWEGVRDNFV